MKLAMTKLNFVHTDLSQWQVDNQHLHCDLSTIFFQQLVVDAAVARNNRHAALSSCARRFAVARQRFSRRSDKNATYVDWYFDQTDTW